MSTSVSQHLSTNFKDFMSIAFFKGDSVRRIQTSYNCVGANHRKFIISSIASSIEYPIEKALWPNKF